VSENINGVKSEKYRKRYDHLFLDVLPKDIKQRNVFAHRYFHAIEKVQWTEAWEMVVGEFPNLRRLLGYSQL
jgi:hypothetical protein